MFFNKKHIKDTINNKMETIFNLFTKKQIYFCSQINNISTSNIRSMKKCFDVFVLNKDWLFYKLMENCEYLGFIDDNEILIKPYDGYHDIVCVVRLFKDGISLKDISSNICIYDEEYESYKKDKNLDKLIDEVTKNDKKDTDEKLTDMFVDIINENIYTSSGNYTDDTEYTDETEYTEYTDISYTDNSKYTNTYSDSSIEKTDNPEKTKQPSKLVLQEKSLKKTENIKKNINIKIKKDGRNFQCGYSSEEE